MREHIELLRETQSSIEFMTQSRQQLIDSFPLHASEISDKSETGREKHISVSAESSHFFPFKIFGVGGAKM